MASEEEQKNQGDGKGFAGLSSMVSDVDATVASAPKQTSREASTSSTQHSSQASRSVQQEQPEPTPLTYQAPAQPSGGSSIGKWLIGIAVVIGVISLANQSSNRSSGSGYSPGTSSPTVEQAQPRFNGIPVEEPGTSLTTVGPAPQPHAPRRPTEDKPSIGRNNVLSTAQIRYCLAEKIRLDAAETVLNNYNDADVDRFNGYIADYNNRCGEFLYRQGALESARRDVEPYRNQLQAEGRSRFVRSPSAATRSQTPAQTPLSVRPSPDATVQAIQQRLNELGYDAGPADGLTGRRTRSSIVAFQEDRGLALTGAADKALLLQLQQGSPRRTPESRPANISAQCTASYECAGSNQCLDGHCRPPRVANEQCRASYECAGSNQCLDGHCRPSRVADEQCRASYECAGSNQCLDGHCRPSRVADEQCRASYECAGSNQCLDGHCRPSRVAGEQCRASYECAGSNQCIQGKCQ